MKYISNKIREISKRDKKSLKSIAEDVGVSVSTFSRFMRGDYVPSYAQVIRIADVLKVDIKTRMELLSAAHAGVLRYWRKSSPDSVPEKTASDDASPEADSTEDPAV